MPQNTSRGWPWTEMLYGLHQASTPLDILAEKRYVNCPFIYLRGLTDVFLRYSVPLIPLDRTYPSYQYSVRYFLLWMTEESICTSGMLQLEVLYTHVRILLATLTSWIRIRVHYLIRSWLHCHFHPSSSNLPQQSCNSKQPR